MPRHAEPVLEPAALDFLAAGRELVPEVVDLFLVLAVHHERDRLRELEHRTAVQRRELLSVELERHRHDRSRGPAGGFRRLFVVAGDAADPGILEDRHVELRRLFGLVVEPQERGDFLRLWH